MWIGGKTVEELYQPTMRRIDDLKNEYGYEVHVKWECEFREELKRDPELKAEYDEILFPQLWIIESIHCAAEEPNHSPSRIGASWTMKKYTFWTL